ncbi:MAG: MATE family efflux transporter [Gammaproteobacteria bacterium]
MREHASNHLHKKVLLMAGPIIISNATVPLVGMVDTAVVGHLPNPAYIGAVALGAAIFSFVFWGFSFLRMGTTGFVAQAHGADDAREIRTVLARGLMLALLLGGLILLLRENIITVALAVLDSTAEIESLSADYVRLRIWAAPAMLINFTLLGALIGLQRAGLALLLQLLLNFSNIALDLLFVLGLGYAVKGVALASALSEWLAALAGLLIIYRQLRPGSGGWFYPLWNSRELLAMMRVNGNIFIRTLCLNLAYFYFTATSARLGPELLAANALLIQLQSLMAYGLDGFAHAAEALAGSAYGARQRAVFLAAVHASTLWAFVVAVLIALAYGLVGDVIIGLMTSHTEVLDIAGHYLPWMVIAPLLSVWSFQLDGIFIGATRSVEMRNAALFSLLVFVPSLELLVYLLGNHGLWLAMMVLMLARTLSLLHYFPRLLEPLR